MLINFIVQAGIAYHLASSPILLHKTQKSLPQQCGRLFYVSIKRILFCDTDSHTVCIVLSEWLNGVTLELCVDAVSIDVVLVAEDVGNIVHTSLREASVDLSVTCTLVSIARESNFALRIFLHVSSKLCNLCKLRSLSNSLVDLEEYVAAERLNNFYDRFRFWFRFRFRDNNRFRLDYSNVLVVSLAEGNLHACESVLIPVSIVGVLAVVVVVQHVCHSLEVERDAA